MLVEISISHFRLNRWFSRISPSVEITASTRVNGMARRTAIQTCVYFVSIILTKESFLSINADLISRCLRCVYTVIGAAEAIKGDVREISL